MKKLITLILSLSLIFSLSACSRATGNTKTSQKQRPSESSKTPTSEDSKKSVKILGIGETGEVEGLALTVDKITKPDDDMLYSKPKDGFEYIMIWYTFENRSDEEIKTPGNTRIYIVYEEGKTGSDCDMTSDDAEAGYMPKKKEGMYASYTKLAPGETTSGWMLYQKPVDMEEITVHYYTKFINEPASLVFRFPAE